MMLNYTEGTLGFHDEELFFHEEFRKLQQDVKVYKRNLNDFYFILVTIITFTMQIGFSFMEVGLVRTKNTTNILLKCTVDAFVGCTSFWLTGFALAWSEGNSFVGWNHFAFSDIPDENVSSAFYQLIFANTASTIVSGAVAERLNLPCYFVYGTLLTGISYPIVSRWGWYDHGWLKVMGLRDFGGSGLVHMYSGCCAFIAAGFIGPRVGRFGPNGHHLAGHSLPFVGFGLLILIFGFLAFNAGSELSSSEAGDGVVITMSALNTLLASCSGALSVLLIHRYKEGYWSYIAMANGSVAGMASVCAGCDSLEEWGAVLTGILASFAFTGGRHLLEKWEIDDPIDAFPIHFCGGSTGLLSAPFLVSNGILFKWDADSFSVLGVNVLAWICINAWAILWCVPIFGTLKWAGVLRIPAEMETSGIDVIKHNEQSYPLSAWVEDFNRRNDWRSTIHSPNKESSFAPRRRFINNEATIANSQL